MGIVLGEYTGKNGNNEDCYVIGIDEYIGEDNVLLLTLKECRSYLLDEVQFKVNTHISIYPGFMSVSIDKMFANATNANGYTFSDRSRISSFLFTLAMMRIDV